MAERVVLHVGLMKSGTTFLQALLFANQERLAGQGVLVPGAAWGDQARGVIETLGATSSPRPRWDALMAQVAAHPGTSVISMEYLGAMRASEVRDVVASIPANSVEVVVTLRDLNRALPSMWQETVRNGRSWEWADYRAGVRLARPRSRSRGATGPLPESGRTFWRQQDALRIVSRWGEEVGAGNVAVVTVPAPGSPRDELTRRFAFAVGFDPDSLIEGAADNSSLGLPSTLVLRALNERLAAAGHSLRIARPVVKRLLAREVLAARSAVEARLGSPVRPWVRRSAARLVAGLAASGATLVGSWEELAPIEVPGVEPDAVAPQQLVEAARAGFTGLRRLLMDRGVDDLDDWPGAQTPDAAVAALTGLVRRGIEAGVR